MTKKKLLTIAMCIAMVAIMAVGTLAYFNDVEEQTNTFSLSAGVDITMDETDENGDPFEQDQKLIPGDNSHNAIAKIVTISNGEDSEPAWVWVEMLIPEELYNSKTASNENNNALHYNQFIDYLQGYTTRSSNVNAKAIADNYEADHQWSTFEFITTETVDDKTYCMLRTTHKDALEPGKTTSPALNQIYMDDDVYFDNETKSYMIPANGKQAGKATTFVPYDGSWEVIVRSYAVQAAGLADVNAAVAAYAAQGK